MTTFILVMAARFSIHALLHALRLRTGAYGRDTAFTVTVNLMSDLAFAVWAVALLTLEVPA